MQDILVNQSANAAALSGSAVEVLETSGVNILARWARLQRYWDSRLVVGMDPYARIATDGLATECSVLTRGRERLTGVNFASHDYLSLASHAAIRTAASEAIARWGVHSGGSASLQGATLPLATLEERLADVWQCQEATVFPTGWSAGYGIIKAVVREPDHIVIDSNASAALQEGASNATRNVHVAPHRSIEAVEEQLKTIRQQTARAGILVVTDSLFGLNSTVANLRVLRGLCRDYEAALLVDVSHDFGAMGPAGLGFIGEQGLLGQIDLIVGSFSKTFASNGGFVASSVVGLKQALRTVLGPSMFTSAMSPVQASVVNAALTIVRSKEGARRRSRLMRNVTRLRRGLAAQAFKVIGEPSPVVPVWAGPTEQARLMTRAAHRLGALVNLLEYPIVPLDASCWRLQVMANHTRDQIDRMLDVAVAARQDAGPLPRILHLVGGAEAAD